LLLISFRLIIITVIYVGTFTGVDVTVNTDIFRAHVVQVTPFVLIIRLI